MGKILSSLPKTIHTSLAISILLFLGLFFNNEGFDIDRIFWSWLFRYIHVVVGIMWIGLLWYFNFVQIPNMPKIPDEHKPAIGKVIAPAALFYFRWAALATIVSGLILGWLKYGQTKKELWALLRVILKVKLSQQEWLCYFLEQTHYYRFQCYYQWLQLKTYINYSLL